MTNEFRNLLFHHSATVPCGCLRYFNCCCCCRPRVLCLISTYPDNYESKALHVAATWAGGSHAAHCCLPRIRLLWSLHFSSIFRRLPTWPPRGQVGPTLHRTTTHEIMLSGNYSEGLPTWLPRRQVGPTLHSAHDSNEGKYALHYS